MPSREKLFREALSLCALLLLVFGFKSTFLANYTVPTGSMEPTILPGDKLFVNKMAYDVRIPFTHISLLKLGDPDLGDVVIIDTPEMLYVKRLVGRPGDQIEIENGFISINGKPLVTSLSGYDELEEVLTQGGLYDETLGSHRYQVQRLGIPSSYPPIKLKLPPDCYFAMGDNRDNSLDSRKWGCFHREQVLGIAKFIYFSLDWPESWDLPKVRWERIGNSL